MSWKFPARNISNPEVVSIDDVNQNFREVIEEASGALNEHNWKANSFGDRGMLANDAGIVVHRVAVEVNPNTDPDTTADNQFVRYDQDWQSIVGLTHTFNTTGGLVWFLASIQGNSPLSFTFLGNGGTGRFGVQFALELNGAVLAQSIVGGGDLSNDQITVFRKPSPPKIGFQVVSTPGVESMHFGVCSEAIVDVPPGKHTIRAVCCTPRASDDSDTGVSLDNTDKWLGSRELITVQLLR